MIGGILSVLIAVGAGIAGANLLYPLRCVSTPRFALNLCLGAGLGVGALSCVSFVPVAFLGNRYLIALEWAVLAVLGALVWLRRKEILPVLRSEPAGGMSVTWPTALLLCVAGGLAVASFVTFLLVSGTMPYGLWDAFMIWNLHALFIFRGGPSWTNYLAANFDWTHPDYPLLMPLAVARGWMYGGMETQLVPMVLSGLFFFATVALLLASLWQLRSLGQGCLGAILLMGSPLFVSYGAGQIADIPLSFYFLASIALLALHDREEECGRRLLALSGIMAGLSAWAKNEGLLFLCVLLVARVAAVWHARGLRESVRQALWLLAGCLPILAMIGYFKGFLTPQNDLFVGQSLGLLLSRAADPGRHVQILGQFIEGAFSFTGGLPFFGTGYRFRIGVVGLATLILCIIFMGVRRDRRDLLSNGAGTLTLGLMVAGYYAVYTVTPHRLDWHLFTSLYRLFLQLWPLAIFLCLMVTETPEAGFNGAGVTKAPAGPSQSPSGKGGRGGGKAKGERTR